MADFDDLDDVDAPGDFEEYDEDFESELLTAPGKPGSGMDTFCVVASFCVLLGAIAVLGWGVLYEVYDVQLGGVFPAKEQPSSAFPAFDVLGFGRDDAISGVYNYATIRGGRADGLVPGTILWIQDPAQPKGRADEYHWVTLMVSDDLGDDWCRADIVNIRLPKRAPIVAIPVAAIPTDEGDPGDDDAPADDAVAPPEAEPVATLAPGVPFAAWESQESFTAAAEGLARLLDRPNGLKAVLAPWDLQKLRKHVEEDLGGHTRERADR